MLSPGCTGKHRYASAALAWRVVRRNKAWHGRRKLKMLTAYRCRECGGYHIGKTFTHWKGWIKYGDE